MQSHSPVTAARPRFKHNYYSTAAWLYLIAARSDKSHGLE